MSEREEIIEQILAIYKQLPAEDRKAVMDYINSKAEPKDRS